MNRFGYFLTIIIAFPPLQTWCNLITPTLFDLFLHLHPCLCRPFIKIPYRLRFKDRKSRKIFSNEEEEEGEVDFGETVR